MYFSLRDRSVQGGFTLIELLVVISIIGILASVVMMSINDSRRSGRDAGRKNQIQEVLKAAELYYTDAKLYPLYGSTSGAGGYLNGIESNFYGTARYLSRLPDEAATRYYYCVSTDRRSILIAVDTENDMGGSNFCNVLRGPGPDYGCNAWIAANAFDTCISRF